MSALGILAILKSLGIEMCFIKYEELQGNLEFMILFSLEKR